MAAEKQRQAAKKNVRKAAKAAREQKTIAKLPRKARTALGKQGAAVAKRKCEGGSQPKTRQELYEEQSRATCPGVPRWAAPNSLKRWAISDLVPAYIGPRWQMRRLSGDAAERLRIGPSVMEGCDCAVVGAVWEGARGGAA